MQNSKSSELQLVTTDKTPITTDLLDACGLAMDQALGFEKTSLSAISQWNAQAMEMAWSFAPVFCDMFHIAVRSVANYMEWSRYFCLLPYAPSQSGAPQLADTGEVIESQEAEAQRLSAELAQYMDAAIGAEGVQAEEFVLPVPPVLQAREDALPSHRVVESSREAGDEAEAVGVAMGQVA